jgi:predicted transcriptional regulator
MNRQLNGTMRYVVAAREMDKSGLGLADVALLMILSARANGLGYCWPSQSTLASELGASVSTVKRSIKNLVSADIVRVSPTTLPSVGRPPNGYHLLIDKMSERIRSPANDLWLTGDTLDPFTGDLRSDHIKNQ